MHLFHFFKFFEQCGTKQCNILLQLKDCMNLEKFVQCLNFKCSFCFPLISRLHAGVGLCAQQGRGRLPGSHPGHHDACFIEQHIALPHLQCH